MKKFILVHEHEYGFTTYVFKSNSNLESILEQRYSVLEILNINFDEDSDNIIIDEFPEKIETVIL